MKYLVLLAIALAGAANAANVAVTWTNPTTNTDGSSIPSTGEGSLTQVRIEYGTCSSPGVFGTSLGNVTKTMPATSGTLTVGPGTYCVRAFVANTYGAESAASNVASKVIPAPIPNPPSSLQFTSTTAFGVSKQGGDYILGRQAGTVRAGAAPVGIVAEIGLRTYCQVDRADVVGAKAVKGVLVAQCASES